MLILARHVSYRSNIIWWPLRLLLLFSYHKAREYNLVSCGSLLNYFNAMCVLIGFSTSHFALICLYARRSHFTSLILGEHTTKANTSKIQPKLKFHISYTHDLCYTKLEQLVCNWAEQSQLPLYTKIISLGYWKTSYAKREHTRFELNLHFGRICPIATISRYVALIPLFQAARPPVIVLI